MVTKTCLPSYVCNSSDGCDSSDNSDCSDGSDSSDISDSSDRRYSSAKKTFFSKHHPSGPMLSISRNVGPCVHVVVCSFLRYRLNVFCPYFPKFLEIRNPWAKVIGY